MHHIYAIRSFLKINSIEDYDKEIIINEIILLHDENSGGLLK